MSTRAHAPATRARVALVAAALIAAAGLQPATGSTVPGDTSASYIIRAVPGALGNLRDAIVSAGGSITRQLGIINGVTATLTHRQAQIVDGSGWAMTATPNSGVALQSSSYDNSTDSYSLYTLERYVGADKMWAKGYTGQGIDVALIDSGVTPVPGIETSRLVQGPDLTPESINPATRGLDTYGHGTHMASIIAGRDAGVSNPATAGVTQFVGLAPSARLIAVKAADAAGNTDVSQMIAAIDWVVQNKNANGLNIRVLNLSFGTNSVQSASVDPLAFAAEQAWKSGIVVVASAGNSNNNSSKLGDPAIDPYVIAVGAMDTGATATKVDDLVAWWSARGETGARTPDIAAPGVHVQGLRLPGSYVDTHFSGGVLGDRYLRGSGTSQAAAFVSGGAALLLSQRPSLTPDQVKALLRSSATPMPQTDSQAVGSGEINLANALAASTPTSTQTFTASTGTGTLEGSRGGTHVTLDDVELNGEKDINGKSWNSAAMANAARNHTAWSGGTFNGVVWTGSGFDSGSSLAASLWRFAGWDGSTWRGTLWRGYGWESGSWDGSVWRSASWSGSAWRGSVWRDSDWSGQFADASWSSTSWN